MSCVLVFRIGSLGDSLVAIPALRSIAAQHPASRIVLLTNAPIDGGIKAAPSHRVLMGTGLVHEFIEFPSGGAGLQSFIALAGRIRAYGPKSVFCLAPHKRSALQSLRDHVFFRLCGIANIHGLRLIGNETQRRLIGNAGLFESEPLRLLRSIGQTGKPLAPADFSLSLSAAERASAHDALAAAGIAQTFVAISLGTKVPANDWGQANWLAMLRLVESRSKGAALVLLGVSDERARCDELARSWPGRSANLCGQLSPRQSAAVLERALLFIGHDSGPMHLANAVGIPTVAIFSSRNLPGVWFPVGNEPNVFYTDIECRGCELDACEERQMRCIRSIEPESVARKVGELLAQRLLQRGQPADESSA